MIRCDAPHCNDPIGSAGFTCVVCGKSLCAYHSGLCADLKCCENCTAQCASCGAVLPANQGVDLGLQEWACNACLGGRAELMPPSVPIYEDSPKEVIA